MFVVIEQPPGHLPPIRQINHKTEGFNVLRENLLLLRLQKNNNNFYIKKNILYNFNGIHYIFDHSYIAFKDNKGNYQLGCVTHGKQQNIRNQYEKPGLIGRGTYGRVKLVQLENNLVIVVKSSYTSQYSKIEANCLKIVGYYKGSIQVNPYDIELSYSKSKEKKLYGKTLLLMPYFDMKCIWHHYNTLISTGLPIITDYKRVCAYAYRLLHQVKLLHSNNKIHFDISPANILLKQDNSRNIKLIDFGMAKQIGTMFFPSDFTTNVFPFWYAPEVEQARKKSSYIVIKPDLDIFSLGIILNLLFSHLVIDFELQNTIKEMRSPIPQARPTLDKVMSILLIHSRRYKPEVLFMPAKPLSQLSQPLTTAYKQKTKSRDSASKVPTKSEIRTDQIKLTQDKLVKDETAQASYKTTKSSRLRALFSRNKTKAQINKELIQDRINSTESRASSDRTVTLLI